QHAVARPLEDREVAAAGEAAEGEVDLRQGAGGDEEPAPLALLAGGAVVGDPGGVDGVEAARRGALGEGQADAGIDGHRGGVVGDDLPGAAVDVDEAPADEGVRGPAL